MHVLFVHQNFPAQFGHIASHLIKQHGFRCSFVSKLPPATISGIERIQYTPKGGATASTHYCNRTFENAIWHTHAVYEALKERPDIKPDLIVGHSGFGSTLFLRELYDCPIINYFEYFYRPTHSDMDFRPDFPTNELNRLRARSRNAMLLLDLENCNVGYSPTQWQRDRLPALFHDHVRVVFDGVDTGIWHPVSGAPRIIGDKKVPASTRIVTYVSRGMESMRGFDIFMKIAKRLCDLRDDVVFAIAGQDRVCYGGDENVTGSKSFKDWVLSQDDYDLSRFHFLGLVPPNKLAELFAISDVHFYLTVPFVLSWSLMNAMACGATLLASNTEPVQEMIKPGVNGILVDFFDIDSFVEKAMAILDDPPSYRHMGQAGVAMIREKYSLEICLPQLLQLYETAIQSHCNGR